MRDPTVRATLETARGVVSLLAASLVAVALVRFPHR
jgi:hypothetical protein